MERGGRHREWKEKEWERGRMGEEGGEKEERKKERHKRGSE